MSKQKITRFLQSFVAIPLFATTMPLTGLTSVPVSSVVLSQDNSVFEAHLLTPEEAQIRKEHALKIDAFFKSINSPLVGYGKKFVDEAEKNELPWDLLPSLITQESTAYRNICKNPVATFNGFGWGSCKIGFKSIDESIEVVAWNLGGNNPNTSAHYDNKTVDEILKKYNSVNPNYTKNIKKIMKMIDSVKINTENKDNSNNQ